MSAPLRVGVVGSSHWAPDVISGLNAFSATQVTAVAADSAAPWQAAELDAVVIATPLRQRFAAVKAALMADKHVLVQPPLAHTATACAELVALAETRQRTLMVGEVCVYTGAVKRMRELVDDGRLGRVLWFDAVNIDLGMCDPDEDTIWELAGQDLAIMDHVLNVEPRWISAVGASHYHDCEDVLYLMLGFDDELTARFQAAALSPMRARRVTVAGFDRSLVYDDATSAPIHIYESGVDPSQLEVETKRRMRRLPCTGDVLAPRLDASDPYDVMLKQFARACVEGAAPATDAESGLRIVRLLDAARESLYHGGEHVEL